MSAFAGGFGAGLASGASTVMSAYRQKQFSDALTPPKPTASLNSDGTHDYVGMDQGDVNSGYANRDVG